MTTTPENADSSAESSAPDLQNADLSDAATRAQVHAQLTEKIEELRAAYYQDSLLVSDAEYDELVHRLEDLEAKFPELVTDSSPTQTVGVVDTSTFDPVEHIGPMYSLDNVFDYDELRPGTNGAVGHLGEVEVPVHSRSTVCGQPALPQWGTRAGRDPRRRAHR